MNHTNNLSAAQQLTLALDTPPRTPTQHVDFPLKDQSEPLPPRPLPRWMRSPFMRYHSGPRADKRYRETPVPTTSQRAGDVAA